MQWVLEGINLSQTKTSQGNMGMVRRITDPFTLSALVSNSVSEDIFCLSFLSFVLRFSERGVVDIIDADGTVYGEWSAADRRVDAIELN